MVYSVCTTVDGKQCQLVSAPAVLIYLHPAPQCVLVQRVRPAVRYIVVSALAALCHWAAVSWASSITNTTFLIRANHTCLLPARLSCPPHTWKQSAFLLGTTLLSCPPAPPLPSPHASGALPLFLSPPAAPSSIFKLPTCTTLPQM